MIDPILVTVIGIIINAIIVIVTVAALAMRIATKGDIKRLEDRIERVENKLDNTNVQVNEIRGNQLVLTEKINRLESYFKTPTLKTP